MCCLFGLHDPNRSLTGLQKTRLLHLLAAAAEVRGTDASGIAYNTQERLVIRKAPVPGGKLPFRIPDGTLAVMGHTRMTTQGDEKFNRNNHPFLGVTPEGSFVLAHNGIIRNDKSLRKSLKLPRTAIQTDSYVSVQLIEKKQALDCSSLKYMAERVEGSFSFTVLDSEESLYFVKGDSPLYLLRFSNGLYAYASTAEILHTALRGFGMAPDDGEHIRMDSGEILRIGREGELTRESFDDSGLDRGMLRDSRLPGCCCAPTYLEELREAAAWMGYPPQIIDRMSERGFRPQEVEEILYQGEI